MVEYDYIIIGAGSAGSVLAARLSADPAHRVLVLEAGGKDRSFLMRMPMAAGKMFYHPRYNWALATEPEPFADNRRIGLAAGKVLGGSSSINGMMYTRGHPRDYDEWAQLGARGWSHADVHPFFLRAERNWRGRSAAHGDEGPLTVSAPVKDKLTEVILETARNLGHATTDDFEQDGPDGFGLTDLTTHGGRRGSTARQYLAPASRRANLSVVCNAVTCRIVIDGGHAHSVEFEHDGQTRRATARKEIILSAGAYHSPKLLLLSGVGPGDHLRDTGIRPVHELPGVGQNLQDHYGYSLVYRTRDAMSIDKLTRLDRAALAALQWSLSGTGAFAGLPLSAIGYLKTRDGLERPNIELLFTPASLDTQVWFPGWRPANGFQLAISVSLLRPEARGSVQLASADVSAPPVIRHNYLSVAEDRGALLRSAHIVREFMATDPISKAVEGELFPGEIARSDEELEGCIRQTMRSMLHACGTCGIGAGPLSVVDPDLRVRGLTGLRVADASVMPVIPSGHTNAPTIMIAEHAASLVLADGSPNPPSAASL